jgi:hypothetical protein
VSEVTQYADVRPADKRATKAVKIILDFMILTELIPIESRPQISVAEGVDMSKGVRVVEWYQEIMK